MTTIALRPAHELDYVEKGRKLFRVKFPGQDFDGAIWNIKHLRTRTHKKSNSNIYWTVRGSLTEPLPPSFIEPIKAAAVLDLQSPTNLIFRVDSARLLWEHLKKTKDPAAFMWAGVRTDDMLGMEQEMRQALKASSTYKMCMAWNRIIELLVTATILRPMNVPWRTPRPEDTERHTIRGQQERAEKLPSKKAMETIADLFAGLATEPADRLLTCASIIAMCSGVRIGELLTLPEDCIDQRDGRLFLKIWVEKNKTRDLDRRMIPKAAQDLVLEAVTEAKAITAEFRARAKAIEDKPELPPIPGYSPTDRLGWEDVKRVLNLKFEGPNEAAKQLGCPFRIDPQSGERFFRASDVSEYLAKRQGNLFSISGKGVEQTLSETLFVVPVNFLGNGWKSPIPLLIELVTNQQLNRFLTGTWSRCEPSHPEAVQRNGEWWWKEKKSVFDRLDLLEDDGSIIKMTSHQFRHWITTQAKAGGASNPVVARWQNRSHQGDLGGYQHLTMEERVEAVRGAIEAGQVTGDISDSYFALAEDVRDAFLEDQLQYVHVTAMGLCVHDFSASPCPNYLACLKGDCGACRDFLHDRNDPTQVVHLQELETRTLTVLDEEKKLAAKHGEAISEHWLTEQQQVLNNIRQILSTPGVGVVQPFASHDSKFTPIREA